MFSIIRPSNKKKGINRQFRIIQTKTKSHENSTNKKKQNKKKRIVNLFFSILPVLNIKATHSQKKNEIEFEKNEK